MIRKVESVVHKTALILATTILHNTVGLFNFLHKQIFECKNYKITVLSLWNVHLTLYLKVILWIMFQNNFPICIEFKKTKMLSMYNLFMSTSIWALDFNYRVRILNHQVKHLNKAFVHTQINHNASPLSQCMFQNYLRLYSRKLCHVKLPHCENMLQKFEQGTDIVWSYSSSK